MSGIAAIIRFDGGSVEPGRIEKMTAAMDYRGIDGIAHWAEGPAALGHCMLRTTAESLEEVQPLANEDESLMLVMDGWLSNWEELRSDLLARGARLRTRSDAELVLRAFEQWGEDCPRHIDGEYAFLVWDKRRQEAFCARDHAGLRPLHYHWDGKCLTVASDVAGVLANPSIAAKPNRGMIAEFMGNEWLSRTETIWDGIMRLLPAHTMRFGRIGAQASRYWSPPLEGGLGYAREAEYAEHYRGLLADCTRRAARSHLPVGVEVSGGLDSSAIYAQAHDLFGKGRLIAPAIEGYTLLFEDRGSRADEIAYARAVGLHCGETIREVAPFFPGLDWFEARSQADRDVPPFPNGAMSLGLGGAAVRDGCRVILNGQGGDEWLEGSQFYYAQLLQSRDWSGFARALREDAGDTGLRRAAWRALRFGFGPFLPQVLLDLRRKAIGAFSSNVYEDKFWLQPALKDELVRRRRAAHSGALRSVSDPVRRKMLLTLEYPFNELCRDHSSRLNARMGLESRSPMSMRHFIEFAFATPERLRNRGGFGKVLHRNALRGLLPDLVIDRQDKAEFTLAFARLLDGMGETLTEIIPGKQFGFVNGFGVSRLYGRFKPNSFVGNPIWPLWGIFACATAMQSVPGPPTSGGR